MKVHSGAAFAAFKGTKGQQGKYQSVITGMENGRDQPQNYGRLSELRLVGGKGLARGIALCGAGAARVSAAFNS